VGGFLCAKPSTPSFHLQDLAFLKVSPPSPQLKYGQNEACLLLPSTSSRGRVWRITCARFSFGKRSFFFPSLYQWLGVKREPFLSSNDAERQQLRGVRLYPLIPTPPLLSISGNMVRVHFLPPPSSSDILSSCKAEFLPRFYPANSNLKVSSSLLPFTLFEDGSCHAVRRRLWALLLQEIF